ncbi:hypothetical protein SAMN02982929_00963 [Saccharopolyspora kobensis]|uniref:Cas10/Cmr2 second palm domain-containing protein n=2 Tax=Saccharopolyspora kobensis TaxID=146035 RepID=A0A1H5VRC4_9PSEU|nr:hypothetical protein SAMN02982929_00963 [Saccharopolyspora kobensis]SFC57849.1 hypothetical protein SAMN05216506_1011107 [Saccharopolyspora kobensis]
MIREATDPDEVERLLAGWEEVVERCNEAGHIDGVIPLRMHTDDGDVIGRVEEHIVRGLRQRLPAAALRTTQRSGTTWLDAQTGAIQAEHEWPPMVSEWPPGKLCDWCLAWPASKQLVVGAGDDRERRALCLDCQLREEHAGYATSSREDLAPSTERDLLEQWEKRHPERPMTVPDTFEALAVLGEEHDNTHVATVHADGNAIGTLRKAISKAMAEGRGTGFNLPAAIEHATWSALVDALDATTHPDTVTLPVIAHLVGGDDLLISLPAHRAWEFTHTLQSRFTTYLAQSLADAGLQQIAAPTISSAVVFHHRQSPLSQAADLAAELLKSAKKRYRGRAAALAWQDITRDGPQPLRDREALRLDTMHDSWSALDMLASCSASSLANLAGLARDGDPERLSEYAARVKVDDTVRPFTAGPLNLTDALGMVRWWRTA